jgi:hypothetical protein
MAMLHFRVVQSDSLATEIALGWLKIKLRGSPTHVEPASGDEHVATLRAISSKLR